MVDLPNRPPEPALVRSVLVAGTGIAAYVLGHQVETGWIDSVLTIYGLVTPVVAGYLIRRVVKPVKPASGGGRHRAED